MTLALQSWTALTTVLNFAGSDIEDHNMTLQQSISEFVNDRPIQSTQEAPVPGEDRNHPLSAL